MLLLTWISTALALTPGGFRVDTAQPLDRWGVRNVLIVNPGDEIIDQVTPRMTKVWGKYGLEAEVSGLMQTGPGGTLFGGVGNLRTGHWLVFEGKKGGHHRLGLEVAGGITPDRWRPQAFGSSFQDTMVDLLVQAGWRASWNESSPWELRLMLGSGISKWWHDGFLPLAEIAVVKVLPLSENTSLVLEQDALVIDFAMANLRPMLRVEIGDGALDMGLQVPWGSWVQNQSGPASVQLVTQYRGQF